MQMSCGQWEQKEREIIASVMALVILQINGKSLTFVFFYWEKWGVGNHERFDPNYALVKLLRLQPEEL